MEGNRVNDRTTTILEKYDIEVLRSWKGRGAILCETKSGIKVLKEYKGSLDRLSLQQELLQNTIHNGYTKIEKILLTKEGELLVKDEDTVSYYLKEYKEGKECNIKEYKDCSKTVEQLAILHKAMTMPEFVGEKKIEPYNLPQEFEKHNKELRHVKKYLKEKRQKNEFEYYLYRHYDYFLVKAEKILEEVKAHPVIFSKENLTTAGTLCHGDFQHHNVIFHNDDIFLMNFEKFVLDSPMRDLSLFFRKMMEKNNWSKELGQFILESYQKNRKITEEERYQLYYRLSYPEKFWKIVNFYYNSPKSWIPEKNMEKLEKIWIQEEEKNFFLENNYKQWLP